jgi:tRNA-dependent cyclodipeptide synthase
MFNRIVKVLNKLGRKDITILKETDYLSNEQYNLCYEKYVQFFRQDVDLQNNVYKIISNLTLSGRKVINKEIAAQYFLAELPLLLNTPDILGIPSSCFIYHKIMDIAELIYSQKNLQAPNQGFMAVEFT